MSTAGAPDNDIELRAPLRGWVLPLAEVADPVFAQGLAGDGVAIDPVDGVLHAPCEGVVGTLPAGRHALTLRTAAGDLLMHVGIDTVRLQGRGFELLVRDGERVQSGQPLLRFDLEAILAAAPSAVTPVLIAAPGCVIRACTSKRVDVGDPLMVLARQAGAPAESTESAAVRVSRRMRVPFDHGLHARPAATLAAALKPFAAAVTIRAGGRVADARSTVSMMGLGAGRDDIVDISAEGPDASAALDALAAHLETVVAPASEPATDVTAAAIAPPTAGTHMRGRVAVPGLAQGPAWPVAGHDVPVPGATGDARHEREQLRRAVAVVTERLDRLAESGSALQRDILAAHQAVLADPVLLQSADERIDSGAGAGAAWQGVLRRAAQALAGLDDPRMAERRADLLDLERQVLRVLAGEMGAGGPSVPAQSILVARELLPSQLLELEASQLAGICTGEGGVTSHVAILAAALGLPMVVAVGHSIEAVAAGTWLQLDAEAGEVRVEPTAAERAAFDARVQARAVQRQMDEAQATRPAVSLDGVHVHVHCNLGQASEAAPAVRAGAEGCGLLRTEFLFLDRTHAPTVVEQYDAYQVIATALGDRPLTIRTLDAGGDKPLGYVALPREENPALGLRGIRTSLHLPALLADQLRAILRVEPAGQCRILLPMVNDLDEVRAVRAHLVAEAAACGRPVPALGIMIETPAAALMIDRLVEEIDFVSIGSNDLSQYVLAMDRLHPVLAGRLDALHPAVLRLVERVVQACSARPIPVAVCGGMAADPLALPVLLGLGVRELSVVPTAVATVKGAVRALDVAACRELAADVRDLDGAESVRARVRAWFDAREVG